MTGTPEGPLPDAFFDAVYAASADPWGFTDRWYERRKASLLLAVLPEARYREAYEPGCSTGVLTERLARRCDRLLGSDVADRALAAAEERLAAHVADGSVRLEKRRVPDQWPSGRFDLVVVSELAYYLDPAGTDALWAAAEASLVPGGTLVAVHWRHPVPDHPQSGDAVHAALARRPRLAPLVRHVEDDLLLDVVERVDPPATARSVAARTGLRA